jgi:hypothetical protein
MRRTLRASLLLLVLFEQRQRALEPQRCWSQVARRRRDVGVAEEVANVRELGSRFEQATRELATEIVKVQVGDTGLLARRSPSGLDRRDALAGRAANTASTSARSTEMNAFEPSRICVAPGPEHQSTAASSHGLGTLAREAGKVRGTCGSAK